MLQAFITVAGYGMQAAVVILVVILARLLLRKLGAPTVVSYALWVVVLFRLLCPFSIESSIGVIPEELADVPQKGVIEDYGHVPVDTALMSGLLVLGDVLNGGIHGADFRYESEEYGQEGYGRIFPDDVFGLYFGFLWPVGMAVMVLYSIVAYIRLRRKLIEAVPLEGNIWLADHITSPFVMGLFRPKIYLPSSLPENEREYIILHERHHIRRLDHVVKILAFAALCIHWFNPLVWLAFYLSGKDMEMSCDEAVVKKLGADIRADYSASLLKLSTGRTIVAATPLAFGEGDTGSRIKNLAKWKKPAVYITVAAVILCAAVIVLFATNAGDETSLKVRMTGSGTEVTCRFGDDVEDYAVYEDIYLEGERVSSKIVLLNGEHPDKADISKKFYYILNVNPKTAEDGGFTGKLVCSFMADNGSVISREVDLPRDHYTGCGKVLGDGSKNANGIRRDLRDNGEAILFSVILSASPDGSVTAMHKELGVTGANDTVVQYRMVTSDYVRDWAENTLVPNGEFIGATEWVYNSSDLSATPLRIEFDMEYTEIAAACTQGSAVNWDDPAWQGALAGEASGVAIVSLPGGSSAVFPAGQAMYWMPTDADRRACTESVIQFTVRNGEEVVCSGEFQINGVVRRTGEHEANVYIAELYTMDDNLKMKQTPGGAILTLK